ncbi:MAG TPA: ATP-dependent protease, partial [Clostridiales bacterium]|nr:ATP-dependent protease [Clostridiales bacterium]
RLTTGFMKLLFPNVREVGDVNKEEFQQYCLEPAKAMRTIIKMQMSLRDREFQPVVPDITVKS